MLYKFENYLCNICYYCNKITGKNYTYKLNKHQAKIYWFEDGYRKEYNLDVQLYYGPLNISAQEVANMVVTSNV